MSKLTNGQRAALTQAVGHLAAYLDVDNAEVCAVPAEARRVSQRYLESWVMPCLEAVLLDADPARKLTVQALRPEEYRLGELGSARAQRVADEHLDSVSVPR
jgi:hypothetical protein